MDKLTPEVLREASSLVYRYACDCRAYPVHQKRYFRIAELLREVADCEDAASLRDRYGVEFS